MPELLKTALHAAHRRLGARLVDFAGWEMPVQYKSVIAESRAVREGAGMFDVSHMGRIWVRGERALEFLEWITTNDVSKLSDGGSQYSLLCYADGTCVDDIIVYRVSEGVFRIVINASNREKDLDWVHSQNDHGVTVSEQTFDTAMIAVQGPRAVEIVQRLTAESVAGTARFSSVDCTVAGVGAFAARTGYTGEDGFELIVPAGGADVVWDALLKAGVIPCGLAARDVLRVEAGLPLYGHELSDKINPIEAGLGWVCSKDKEFIGSGPINQVRTTGPPRKLVGIKMESRIVPREGYAVVRNGAPIGEITSGVYSPTLECGIAFAFVGSQDGKIDGPCQVLIRGGPHPAAIVSKRFLKGREG